MNTNDLFKRISTLHKERLSSPEREELRRRLISFADMHPVRNSAAIRHHKGEASGVLPPLAFIQLKRKRMIGLILAAMFALSGGVSYAAQGSLPGDMLYPVKIHVNENVEGALAIGAKADADFARTQVARRAMEAEALAKEQHLNGEAKAELVAETHAHLNAFADAETRMKHEGRSQDAAAARAAMQATIEANKGGFLDLGIGLEVGAHSGTSTEEAKGDALVSGDSDSSGLLRFGDDLNSEVNGYFSTSTSGTASVRGGTENSMKEGFGSHGVRNSAEVGTEGRGDVKTKTGAKVTLPAHSEGAPVLDGSGTGSVDLGL